jgi:hypothetical protein
MAFGPMTPFASANITSSARVSSCSEGGEGDRLTGATRMRREKRSHDDRDRMKRIIERNATGREAPIVVGPRALARLIKQLVGGARRRRDRS